MSPAWRLPVAIGAAGLAVVLASAGPELGERTGKITSYGAMSPGAAVLELVTGAALFAAAVALATDPRRRAAAFATLSLGLAWTAGGAWVSSADTPTVLANVGLLLAPMVPPTALLVAALLTSSRRGRPVGVATATVAVTAGVVLWLVRDPFLDRYCWRDCLIGAFAPFADPERARTVWNATLALDIACGLVMLAICTASLRTRLPGRRVMAWALAPGIAVGAVLAASDAALLLEPAENPDRSLFAVLFVARSATVLAFAAGIVAATVVRRRVVRGEIARLARDAERTTGVGLAASLAQALDDPELQVGYPLADGGVVDSDGRAVTLPDSAINIVRGRELVALVSSPNGVPRGSLDRELGPAGRLTLANERLRAEQLARLHELTELRRRIVATGDATRRRLEHDLHDGAQQRLLALTFDLRVAIARAESADDRETAALLQSALELVTSAAADLREVAHGIFPTVLTTSGLVAAVQTLADSRPLALVLDLSPEQRFPPDVEAAAYAVVAEGTDDASTPVRVEISERDDELVVTVDDAPWNGGVVSVEDRIGAVGGTIEWSGRRLEARLPLARAAA